MRTEEEPTLHVSVFGEAEPAVLMCHSTGLAGSQWARLVRTLAPRRCVVPDWLGCGASDAPGPCGKDWRVDRDGVRGLLTAEQGPVDLVGHSYGGFLALQAARWRPEAVRAVVVHEPVLWGALRSGGSAESRERFQGICDGLLGVERGGEAWLRGFIDFWNGPGAWAAMSPERAGVWRRDGAQLAAEVHALIDDDTPHTAWASLDCPVLVTCGAQTEPLEREVCELLVSQLPAGRLVEVPGGHMAPLTHGRRWLDAVSPFMTP